MGRPDTRQNILSILTGFLQTLEPETAHNLTLKLLPIYAKLKPHQAPVSARLKTSLAGIELAHPLGLAAGFDKDAQAYNALFSLGFAFVEVGSVTPQAQAGNPRPRVFRLPSDQAVINRYGFNNQGLDKLCTTIANQPPKGILGINLGKNKDQTDPVNDYVTGLQRTQNLAHYMTINVSSPNTPGLRDLQIGSTLKTLLDGIKTARKTAPGGQAIPVFLKIAPDLDAHALHDIVGLTIDTGMDGMIVSNTTIARPASLQSNYAAEAGGLSGAPLFEKSTAMLREAAKLAQGKLALIGVGGIATAEQAYAKIKAGASALQLYTGLIYGGPALVPKILAGLDQCLARDGFAQLSDAVGVDVT